MGPAQAHAEGEASPTGKGIAGGILLGAEVVMLTEAIIGVNEAWPYPVFGALGAAGGGVGGYFVETTDSAEASIYMLAGGMALAIPTLVAVLNATAYDPTDDEELDESELPDSPETEPTPGTIETTVEVERTARRPLPPALLGIDGVGVALGVPAVAIVPRYTVREMAEFGVEQQTELRVQVLHASF